MRARSALLRAKSLQPPPRSRARRRLAEVGLVFLLSSVPAWLSPTAASAKKAGVTEITVSHAAAAGARATSDIAVDASTDTVFVTGSGIANPNLPTGGRVWVIDGRNNKVVATLHLIGASNAGVALNTATDTLYVADAQLPNPTPEQPGGVTVIDGQTHKVRATISIPGLGGYALSGGPRLAVDSSTNTVYANGPGYSTDVISGRTDTVTATVPYPYYPGPIAVDTGSDAVYATGGASGGTTGVWVINGHTDVTEGITTTSPVTILTPGPPAGIAVDSRTGRIYVTGATNAAGVSIIHRGANRIVHTIRIKNGNIGEVGVDTAANSIYVTAGSVYQGCPGFVSQINGKTNKVTATVNGIEDATAVAVDSKNHMVYVTNGNKVAVFHGGYSRKQKKCGGGGIVLGG
jgi:DNA-binding beta-propeller fold protein YncE